MGTYLNLGKEAYVEAANSDVFVEKMEMRTQKYAVLLRTGSKKKTAENNFCYI